MYSEPNEVLRPAQAGLSLVEIMVGVLIGMIGIIVIFQMLATSEARKRSATAGSDVQISGVIGLTSIERDVREAGYGFSSAGYDTGITPLMGCMVNAYDSGGRPAPAFTYRLTPVQIVVGAGAAADSLIVLRGNGSTFPAAYVFTESSDTSKKTRGRAGISPRDYLLVGRVTPTLQCMTIEVTDVSDADSLTIRHNQGSYSYTTYLPDGSTSVSTRIARFNNATPPITFTAGYLFNLGNGPRRNIWTVNQATHKLQVTNDLLYLDLNPTPPLVTAGPDNVNDSIEVADNVITLKAQYGIDANNNGRIENSEWTTTDPTLATQWANILAVRLAILVRSGQFERTTVTSTVPSWTGGQFVITNLDGSPSSTTPTDPSNNWRNYRYRVYETLVPLRNMLWGSQIRP